jgi:short-subunit dehydrogenase
MKIFITGGTTGLGWALATLYARENHKIGICGRDLTKLPPNWQKEFPQITAYVADVTERPLLQHVIREFAQGELDIMIANAGISMGNKSPLPDFAATRKILDINVGGVLNCLETALDIMLPRKKGQLVLIGSVAGMVGLPATAAYSASKAYVLKLGESYALDLKHLGIHVTTIAPGFIDTPLTRKNKHPMPFMISLESGACKIKSAIDKRKTFYAFPWKMSLTLGILERLPRSWYRLIMGLVAKKIFKTK